MSELEKRTVDELMSKFNQKLADIDCPIKEKIELLGIVIAIVQEAQAEP